MKHEQPAEVDAIIDAWSGGESEPETQREVKVADVPSVFEFEETGIEWALAEFVAMSAVTMLSGEPGVLKSSLLTAAGRAIADGADFAGIPTTRREMVILDRGENALPVVQDRYRRLRIVDGDGLRHYGSWLGEVPAPGSATVTEYVAETRPKPVVVVDSAIAFIDGNENDSSVIRAFMRQTRQLANLGAAVVVIHHSGKADSAKQYRGSSDIKAAVDVAYEVKGFGDPTRLERLVLKAFKSRFATRQTISLRFDGSRFHAEESKGPVGTLSVTERLRKLLIDNTGITTTAFVNLAATQGLGRDRARAFLAEGKQNGTISCSQGSRNAQLHAWVDRPNTAPADLGF